jgi:predicted transcriptional regulator
MLWEIQDDSLSCMEITKYFFMDSNNKVEIKQKILEFLNNHPNQHENEEIMFDRLKLKVDIKEFEKYLDEMEDLELLINNREGCDILLTEIGKDLIKEGGYNSIIIKEKEQNYKDQKNEELKDSKLLLEVSSLKRNRWMSIPSFVIGIILAFVISLVFLIIKISEWIKQI